MTTSNTTRLSMVTVLMGLAIGVVLGSGVAFWVALSTWRSFQQSFTSQPQQNSTLEPAQKASQASSSTLYIEPPQGRRQPSPKSAQAVATVKATKPGKRRTQPAQRRQPSKRSKTQAAAQPPSQTAVPQKRAQPPGRWVPTPLNNPKRASSYSRNQTFIYSEADLPTSLNPLLPQNAVGERTLRLLFEKLWERDSYGRLHPHLAVGWKRSPTHRFFRVMLRQKVRWHDGRMLTAHDVVFSIQMYLRYNNTTESRQLRYLLRRVKARSSHTVTFFFRRPVKKPWDLLNVWIVPKHYYSKPKRLTHSHRISQLPLGSGPYFRTSWHGRKLTFIKFADHWEPSKTAFSKIKMQVITDRSIAIEVLRYGGIDAIMDFDFAQVPPRSTPRPGSLFVQPFHSKRWWSIVCNTSHPILNSQAVRRALYGLMNLHLPQVTQVGTEELIAGPFTPNSPHAIRPAMAYSYRIQEAIHALRREGWSYKGAKGNHFGRVLAKDGKTFSLRLHVSLQHAALKPALTRYLKSWRSMGIDIRLQWYSAPKFHRQVERKRDFDLALRVWDASSIAALKRIFHSRGDRNYGNYQSTKVDKYLAAIEQSRDHGLTHAYFVQLHRQLEKENPHLFLWYLPGQMIYSRRMRQVQVVPHEPFQSILQWYRAR